MNDTLKEAQSIMLDILIEFDKICKKYNLTYWLDYGTLLGAVRHKGFIPWDDDLDVAMPRDDYNKFLKIAKHELGDKYFLQNKDTDKNIYIHFSKIRDLNSLYIEKNEKSKDVKYSQGIYIDIFPVNFINSSIYSKTSYSILKIISKIFSNRYLSIDYFTKPIIKIINLYHNKNNTLVVRGGEKMTNELKLNKHDIFPLQELLFENLFFKVPKNTDKYLRSLYGSDYLVPPPVHLRKRHSIAISLKKGENIKNVE